MALPGSEPFNMDESFKIDFHCDFNRELHQPQSVEEAFNTAKQLGWVRLEILLCKTFINYYFRFVKM